jgi:hypothetical protein
MPFLKSISPVADQAVWVDGLVQLINATPHFFLCLSLYLETLQPCIIQQEDAFEHQLVPAEPNITS